MSKVVEGNRKISLQSIMDRVSGQVGKATSSQPMDLLMCSKKIIWKYVAEQVYSWMKAPPGFG